MKKFKNIIYAILAISTIAFVSCEKNFLELSPQDSFTDAVYFTKPTDFKSYTAGFYSQLQGWKYFTNIYSLMDVGSDLSAPASTLGVASIDYARGAITVPSGDGRWSTPYSWIRTVNILIQKGSEYKGNSADIAPYVSEAYFFRANAYFELLRNYGGVPIVTTVLDTKSEELTATVDMKLWI